MKKSYVIGIMGPGEKAGHVDMDRAEKIGALIAQKGWTTLTGGRPVGVMEAALKGAKSAGGKTIGILMSKDKDEASEYADVVIATGMGSGRNILNVLTSDIIVACGGESGTASEVALALKEKKPVILLTENQAAKTFFQELVPELVSIAKTPEDVVHLIEQAISLGKERKRA